VSIKIPQALFFGKTAGNEGLSAAETAWEVRGSIPPMAKILIVDDEPDASRAVGFYLEKCGHQVTCVRNGRDLSKVAP
jgi:PleD family two-component response regulator